ncbi:MAG: hypothetical protein HXY40_06925 [Chloroflexi bacterium]|nr:hypothetical protein [Chloroflexota bacterium]
MNRFAGLWTKSANPFLLLLVVLTVLPYSLPWLVNRGAGLSFNAYDLAEWASLHPVAHTMHPAMLPTLLLRAQLTIITLMIALCAGRAFSDLRWGFCALLVVALVLAQMPPFEFFAVARTDTNYGMQFTLTLFSLFVGVVALSGAFSAWRTRLMALLALAGIVTSLIALAQVHGLMRSFDLQVQIGVGGFGLSMVYAALMGWLWIKKGAS